MRLSDFGEEVKEWQLRTFGPGDEQSHLRSLAKVREEYEEFMADLSGHEAADIIIALFGWANRRGIDLASAIEEKWDIVKARSDQKQRDVERGIRQEASA